MAFENLSERERQVLYNLVTHYINSADPVGSRVIANRFNMGVSSATIRNTLQDLEELGLVEQPHTSAGRVPTHLGYRIYVDYLLKPEALTQAEMEFIKGSILLKGSGVDEILGQTSKVLGDITRQLGVSIAPKFDEGRLRRLELIPLTDERIMVVVVVDSGLAKSVIIEIKARIGDGELRVVESVLNERLAGLTLGEIRRTMADRLSDVSGQGQLVKILIDTRQRIWSDIGSDSIHMAGMEHLLHQPEFAEVNRISDLLRLIGDQKMLSDFLDNSGEAGLVITIGKENKLLELMNCSVVTSSYKVGSISGMVGIIGPTRMPYSKLASVVKYTARTITDVLSGAEEDKDD
ncbi:MAG TPA: heat-inducible transcriptional repressor HrcA [candidate division Zixibacteria bacterium]|nr:heat-inducible transcriptional repressor HrcA [candidate division Zixibacteria bacterium]